MRQHYSETKDKDATEKEDRTPVSLMITDAKILNKIAELENTSKRSSSTTKWDAFQGLKDGATFINPCNTAH